MKRDNKIGLLVAIMLLSVCTFGSAAYSKPATEGVILTASGEDDSITTIKANKETLESAKADMAEKKYESAITYLDAYISGKPKRYEGYKLRGECYYALRNYELARQDFQTAVDIKRNDDKFITGTKVVSAYVLGADKEGQTQNPELGILYGELMYAQKALNDPEYEESFRKAFEYNSHQYLPQPKANDIIKINCPQKYGKIFNPQGYDADIMAIVNDIEKGDYHEAAYKLPELSAKLPKYYLTHYLTGVVMAGLEQDTEAIAAFERALKLNPNDFESLASLGQVYYSEAEKTFSKEKAKKSIEYFEKAIKFNPNISTYNYYIGLNNLLIGDNDAAISAFDKALAQRSNDYNSMYYKAVAQQIKGDYASVIDGTTKLLNRHVSNYNSVLYLQALAYAKSGNEAAALEDVEKIFSGMNDIYNADIKSLSAKESTLASYLHYLKAQILSAKGEDAEEEYNLAFENPVIKSLSSTEGFDFSMSANDLENQVDYMKTTFENCGKIIPNADGYRITSSLIPRLEMARPEFKLLSNENTVDLTPSISQKIIEQNYTTSTPKAQVQDISTPSISQKLASPEFSAPKVQTAETPEATVEKTESEGIKIGTKLPFESPIIPSKGEPMIFTASEVKSSEEIKAVADATQKAADTVKEAEQKADETVIAAAEEVKQDKKDVLERLNEDVQNLDLAKENAAESLAKTIARAENDVEANAVQSVEQVAESTPKVILPDLAQTVEAASAPGQIREKYADVDLNEYNVKQKMPVINPGDEVIVFDPQAAPFFSKNQQIAAVQSATMNTNPKVITDDFSQIHKAVKETVETVSAETVEKTTETVEQTAEKVAEQVVENIKKEAEPELITVADVPSIAPKVKQASNQVQEVKGEVESAQTAVADAVKKADDTASGLSEQEQEWLKDFLSKAEETSEDTTKKAKKVKAKKEKTVEEFLDDTDEKLLKDAQREAEKLEKAKAKQAAKLLKQEEKLAKKAERDAQKAVEKEEKRIAAEAKKALKAEQKAVKEEEKALKQAPKAVEKKIADENAAAVTVIEGDKLIKVKNKKDKETKKFTWWWNRKKSEASVIENEVQTTKRKWFRKGE